MLASISTANYNRRPNHFGKTSRNCLLIPGHAEDRRLRKLLNYHCFQLDYQECPPAC
jgi:hypothetical protein